MPQKSISVGVCDCICEACGACCQCRPAIVRHIGDDKYTCTGGCAPELGWATVNGRLLCDPCRGAVETAMNGAILRRRVVPA